jgi:RimJ/RimL family protein N-acetyltransferase
VVWFNDPEICIPLGDEAYTICSIESARAQVQAAMRPGSHTYSIVRLADDRLIGRCLLFNHDPIDGSAMLGIAIGEKDCWNQGFGREAMLLLLDLGFNLLNLHNVMLGVYSFNHRAIQSYKKIGFKPIGWRREARQISGVRYDALLMDILADEFRALHGPGQAGKIVEHLVSVHR